MHKKVFIVGSTGSLGMRAFDISLKLGLEIVGISGYKNINLLKSQAEIAKPMFVLANGNSLSSTATNGSKFLSLDHLVDAIAESKPDIVLFLASSITSLRAIDFCLKNSIRIGIANKESIISAGELIFEGKDFGDLVLPIDSETSAIFQLLLGEKKENVQKIIITASGGPFFGKKREELKDVKLEEILKHPNWAMGKKITVDSANLVNKAFEIIETHFLFNFPYASIEAIVHRESIIHAIVKFVDKEMKALMSVPDMAIPIQYALTYPDRGELANVKDLDFLNVERLTFYEIDKETFPLFDGILNFAMVGGSYLPAIVATDEALVEELLSNKISFLDLEELFFEVLSKVKYKKLDSIEEVEDIYKETFELSKSILRR